MKNNPARTKEDFESPSWLFKLEMFFIKPLFTGPRLLRPFVSELRLNGSERILEFGCGNGIFLSYLAQALDSGGMAVGIDTSSYMVSHARERLRHFRNVNVMQGDIRILELEPGEFDLVVFIHVLHDVEPECRLEILESLVRLLKPKGRMCFMEPVSASHGMPIEEIQSLLDSVGMVDIDMIRKGRRVKVFSRKA